MSLLGVKGLKDQEEELEKTNPAYVSRISPSTERRRIANARTSAFESKLFTLSSQLIKKKTRSHVIPISPLPTPTTTVSLGTCAYSLECHATLLPSFEERCATS